MLGGLFLPLVVAIGLASCELVGCATVGRMEIDGDIWHRDLFNCQLSLAQKPELHKVQLGAYNLLLAPQRGNSTKNLTIVELEPTTNQKLDKQTSRITFEKINYKEPWHQMHLSTLDPSLPFTFFINGFNHHGAINGSWLEGASRVLVSHGNRRGYANSSHRQSSNIVFLPWQLTGIESSDLVSMIEGYYRTMASYNVLMEEIAQFFTSVVDFVEKTKAGGLWGGEIEGSEMLNSVRAKHYAKFKFYAHSLGSHLVSNSIDLVHKSRPWVKFGTMVGLDPALPCFIDDNYGLSAFKLSDSVNQVQIIHSNAAFSGIYTDRGHVNIVLNGGTFQPSCHLLDFTCSHIRSTDVFTYSDDRCEMVAYRCSKYEQFKLGACETCDSMRTGTGNAQDHHSSQQSPKCVLVNLAEQSFSAGEQVLLKQVGLEGDDDAAAAQRIRHLADNDVSNGDNHNSTTSTHHIPLIPLIEMDPKLTPKGYGYHYVNTNSHFRASNTHCLQHYQLRLLTLAEVSQVKCPLGSYFLDNNSDGIRVKLMYEEMDLERKLFSKGYINVSDERTAGLGRGIGLTPIVSDKLYTGLLTFSGKAELFVGAIIDSIDVKKLLKCMIEENEMGEIRFTLDIAFMSNTRPSVRHSYSSILCGKWDPFDEHDDEVEEEGEDLVLTLCKQSELTNVSGQIDEILDQIKFQHQYDSWKVSLLNNLFYLYSKWEPLR